MPPTVIDIDSDSDGGGTLIDIDSDSDVPPPSKRGRTATVPATTAHGHGDAATVIIDTPPDTEACAADGDVQAQAIGIGGVGHTSVPAVDEPIPSAGTHGTDDNDDAEEGGDNIAEDSTVPGSPSQPSHYMFWQPPAPNDTTNLSYYMHWNRMDNVLLSTHQEPRIVWRLFYAKDQRLAADARQRPPDTGPYAYKCDYKQ